MTKKKSAIKNIKKPKSVAKKTVKKLNKKPAIKKPVIKKAVKKVVKKIISKPKSKAKIPVIVRPKEIISDSKDITDLQILESFLGGQNKVRLWKVFVLNQNKDFVLKDLIRLTKIKHDTLIFELRDLMKLGIVKAGKKEKTLIYKTNRNFPLLAEITEMVLAVIPRSVDKILEKLNRLNRLKVVLLSGFFTAQLGKQKSLSNATNAHLDLLLVFEKIPDNVEVIVLELEYSIGKELAYSALDQNDFKYRHSIGDKLIRDVLDFDHIIAMDKLSFFR
jgi:hypothetical protein